MRTHQGRRCASIEPPISSGSGGGSGHLPLYSRRRCRSEDVGIRERVVNRVGVRYIPSILAERMSAFDELDALDAPPRSAGDGGDARAAGDGSGGEAGSRQLTISERFELLTRERQQLIAALVKLSMLDADERAIMRAAREPNVAVDTPEFRVFGAMSRRNKLKASIAMRRLARRLPRLVVDAKDDFNGYERADRQSATSAAAATAAAATTTVVNEDEATTTRELSPQSRVAAIKRSYARVANDRCVRSIANARARARVCILATSAFCSEREHVRGVLSDRAFHNELQFRRLNCATLKLYAQLDTAGHAALVARLGKLEAPRLDHLIKRRAELTIGYLYDIPSNIMPKRRGKKRAGQENIELATRPDFFDHLLGVSKRFFWRVRANCKTAARFFRAPSTIRIASRSSIRSARRPPTSRRRRLPNIEAAKWTRRPLSSSRKR